MKILYTNELYSLSSFTFTITLKIMIVVFFWKIRNGKLQVVKNCQRYVIRIHNLVKRFILIGSIKILLPVLISISLHHNTGLLRDKKSGYVLLILLSMLLNHFQIWCNFTPKLLEGFTHTKLKYYNYCKCIVYVLKLC